MSDQDALLAAIRENPEDDTPRLAYADWLDENATSDADRARAEFIRVQCELARIDEDDIGSDACARRQALKTRIEAIEKQYEKVWGEALRGRKGPLRGRDAFFHFRRGFPDKASAPADRLIAEGDALFHLAPITYLSVKDVTPENIRPLLASPWIARVRELSLSAPSGDASNPDWGVLADCLHIRNLTYLWLGSGRFSGDGAARLAAANPFPRLRQLMMSDTALSGPAAEGLFGGPAFGRLDELYCHRCDVGVAAGVLARSEALAGVKKLSLPNQPLTPDALRAVAAGRYWPNLRKLVLYACALDDAAASALAESGPTRLRLLNLSMNEIGPTGAGALANGRLLEGVEVLELGLNPLWDRGLRTVLRSPHLGGLRRLHLGGSGIGPEGTKALAGCPSLSGLLWLTLHSNPITAAGAMALADSPHLAGLEYLSLSNIRGKARQRLKERFGDRVRF